MNDIPCSAFIIFFLIDFITSAFRQLHVTSYICKGAKGTKMMPVSLTTNLQPLLPEKVVYKQSDRFATLVYEDPEQKLNHLYSFGLFGRDSSLDDDALI